MSPRLSYSLFMVLGLVVFVLVRWRMPSPPTLAQVPWWKRALLALWAFIGGALGARLPFLLASEGPLFGGPWLADGKTITTGLIGAYVAVEIVKLFLGIHVKTGDTFALPMACAMAIGRWGCFLHGCCYGAPTQLPWGRDFGDGILRHPTQAYESMFHLTMVFVLLYIVMRGYLRTHQLQFYLICYGIYRFFTEFIRPEPRDWGGLTFYQWTSLTLVGLMAGQWVFEAWFVGKLRSEV